MAPKRSPKDESDSDDGDMDDEQKRQLLEGLMMSPDFHKEFIKELPTDVRARVYGLQGLQKDYADIHAKYNEEMKELEIRYEKLYAPYYQRRSEIVKGTVDATEDEIAKGSKVVEVKEEGEEKAENGAPKGIPNFWYMALKNNEMVEEVIHQRDEEALKALCDITAKNFDDPQKGFTLTFHFMPNDYFTNTELTKTYHLVEDDEILIEKCEGCDIDWKPGQDLTVVVKKKKQKHKGGKNTRVVTKEEPCETFFNFFKPPQVPDDDDEEEDDDVLEEREELVEQDYEIGRTIKDRIIPRAVDWFTGEAMPRLPMFDHPGGDMGDDDDYDEGGQKMLAGADGQNPECKQQ